ncbi:hypothetical protein PHAVU_006G134300 [Phaseolus vulgaris]|uniref:Uncharacterized protein n=1 Tax=Phaseolus vulgaris TaxID=3885 RepID=V7BSJ8_PHAVU|nr:hypothetical protein PHAVU_006G134300g [Phaseolus vulgaris]XP_007147552.1 hypothetical protein PHAVU_006G134300g [Phaseolus vulgaris]ESW19545.1 hypothetical protein PHAVU_006G134300g [Phaseolus vulgaris]ESW19546.1 hypothetical protein PHAVU_006G134300g [Phaseolus vulgaris]
MGCFSSKVIARSISFHEERKKRSQRTTNGIPLLEDLIISSGGSDQYLALVCAANTVSNKLHSGSLSSNKSSKLAIEPASSETSKKLKPVSSRLDQVEGKQIERDKKNRSKSWHQFPEHIVQSLAQENSSGFESSKGAARSKSFHTVEEYDDIVNKIWSSKCHTDEQSEYNDEEDAGSGTSTTHHTEEKDCAIKRMQAPSLNKNHSLKERKIVKESNNLSTASESSTVAPNSSPNSHISSSGIKNEEVVTSHRRSIEKGNKRKAVAKRLESLRIPSGVEYPAIASLREWLPAGGIYSPGSYVTPKFGSYSIMDISNENESSENSIFSPELVSAFEQCMQKLEAEEENILKQIVENVDEESEASSPKKEHHA